MFSFPKFKQMKPPPPSTLNKEFSRVWLGWCMIGDREVAREAAAKGIYISLALQFIGTRKEWDYSDVERWFKTEIFTWVYQLLEQKQIFKASHILSNIGVDPTEQLSSILTETTNKQLRDYIADHLQKNEKLEISLFNTWKFIKALEENNVIFGNILEDISHISILKIDQKSEEWKSNVATVLFFDIYDFYLENFLNAEYAWQHLLYNEHVDILKIWINVYFSKDLNYEYKINLDLNIFQKLKNLFLLWEITGDMINQIKSEKNSDFVQNFVLNELSKFGIYTDDEKDDVIKILLRFSKTRNIRNIVDIFEEPTSSINISEFYEKLNVFCINNELYEILSVCSRDYQFSKSLIQKSNKKELSLWLKRKESFDGFVPEEVICNNIITALHYFADDDINNYFQNNPLILSSIILFSKNITFHDIIMSKSQLKFDKITFEADDVLEHLNEQPVFKNLLVKYICGIETNSSNIYHLLETHTRFVKLYDFRKRDLELEIPNFGNEKLQKKFGRSQNINYLYYIKQKRPSKAAKLFILDQFKTHGKLVELKNVEEKVSELVLKNFSKFDILSSCIAFLKMIGISSNNLRIISSAINLIITSNICDIDEIQRLCDNINIKENSEKILNLLEKIILEKYNLNVLEDNFVSIINDYKLLIDFAYLYNLELPHFFLLQCAKSNFWLEFLIFIQIYNYPLDQVLRLITNFKNKEMFEHLYNGLSNEVELNSEKLMSKSSDRLSVSVTSYDLDASFENLFDSTTKTDLLKILIKCHKSGDPPTALLQACQVYKNPLLAVLATCYEPDSVIVNWLTWLSISCDIDLDIIENYLVSSNTVSLLLENVLRKNYSRTLLESFKIFLPENPLHTLVEFLHSSILLNFEICVNHLTSFQKLITPLNYNTVIPDNDYEYTFLNNSYWLISTGLKLIFITLGNCFQSRLHQIKFLNILCTSDFTKNLPIEIPNFCAISTLLQSLTPELDIDLSDFLNTDKRREQIVECIELSIRKKQFNDALELTKYENICKEYVLNAEWSHKFKQMPNCNFWIECDRAFVSANVAPHSAAEFYVFCCTNLTECSETYTALKYAYKWLKQSNYSDQIVETIEQAIWSNYFALDDATLNGSHYDKHETNYLLSEILERSDTKTRFDDNLNDEQLRHLEETIGKILVSGDIIEALRLQKMFSYKNAETEILLNCYELAEGKIKPYEISTEQRLLFLNRNRNLKSVPHRRRTVKSSRTSTISAGSNDSVQTVVLIAEEETNLEDTLTLLETMTDRLKHGSNIASRILMCYRISLNINKPYQEIVKHVDSMSLLKWALENNCRNKIEVVHDIFIIFQWTKAQIVNLIFEELKLAIIKSIDSNLEVMLMWDLNLDSHFHLVLELCSENNSLLGKKLLAVTNNIQQTQMQSRSNVDDKNVNIIVELLIRAHECFNTFCNMEGISSVLRKSQAITSVLLNTKNYKLMVRLLTGIGRYTEMNYIFQILKENDQFEYLLKRSFRKDTGLKMALLKFLKKHCPKNQELYRMVALHFTLFSEVADLWENEASEMINNLIEIAKLEVQNQGRLLDTENVLFSNNDSTKLCLNKAMANYTHAAEYHLHGDKLVSAMNAAKQAELIALQLSMLKSLPNNGSVKCILRLSVQQIFNVITSDLSFSQSRIIIESYNYPVDWGAVLFEQCILGAKLDYLEDYLSAKPLTNTLAQDLTRRFLAKKITTPMSVKVMKEILKKLESVHMRYRLASELGFSDVIETLLIGSQLAYLKDTVWKKGYKQL